MADLEEVLRMHLVTASTDAQERIFPLRMPQQTGLEFPLIVYQRISVPRQYTQDGDANLPKVRTQWSMWAKTYGSLTSLFEQVASALSGYTNEAEGIQSCFLGFELEEWEEQSGLFRRMLDTVVGYKGT